MPKVLRCWVCRGGLLDTRPLAIICLSTPLETRIKYVIDELKAYLHGVCLSIEWGWSQRYHPRRAHTVDTLGKRHSGLATTTIVTAIKPQTIVGGQKKSHSGK